MTEAETAIADLDRELAATGEPIRLERLTLGPGGLQIPFGVDCPAYVRGYQPAELSSAIIQQDVKLVVSPTPIARAGWPGPRVTRAGASPSQDDPRIPRKGDRAITSRGTLTVQAAAGIFVGSELVRIDIQARGNG